MRKAARRPPAIRTIYESAVDPRLGFQLLDTAIKLLPGLIAQHVVGCLGSVVGSLHRSAAGNRRILKNAKPSLDLVYLLRQRG